MRRALTIVLACTLLAACGGAEATRTTAVGKGDCKMTAAAARSVHELLLGLPRPSLSDAGLVLHELTGETESTTTDEGPDGQRDILVLVNDKKQGVLGLRGTSGSRSVRLTARPGCGDVGYLPHEQAYRAEFTVNGEPSGSVEPGEER